MQYPIQYYSTGTLLHYYSLAHVQRFKDNLGGNLLIWYALLHFHINKFQQQNGFYLIRFQIQCVLYKLVPITTSFILQV